jgi:hypothetical protein
MALSAMPVTDLAGWIPIQIRWQPPTSTVEWCYVGNRRFTEPFFEQSIEAALQNPFRLLFRRHTDLNVLTPWQDGEPGLDPSGFIFHMSRSGSTLLAQMLAALRRNVVLSEAGPINHLLSGFDRPPDLRESERVAWLRGLVRALGQRRNDVERLLFVKLEFWHLMRLPLIRHAFPSTPWIFLYRDPLAVLFSQQRSRGAQMFPGMRAPFVFGIDPLMVPQMTMDEYCACVLTAICRRALAQVEQGGGLLVNYDQLPQAAWTCIADHFGVAFTPDECAQMSAVAQWDAKAPSIAFNREARTRNAGGDDLRAIADSYVRPVYEELEARRKATT